MKEKLRQLLKKRFSLPYATFFEKTFRSFSPAEKVLCGLFVLLLVASVLGLLGKINGLFLVERPAFGGSLTEGIVGAPRFVNPLLSLSDADRDLTALIYSGLLKATAVGTLVPDLAERYELSADGLAYTFYLRDDARFHDNMPVTADDVVFTIQKAQDPGLKSPRRANWEGVTTEKIDARTVRLILKQPYAPFLENTTLGILPKHLWENEDAESFPFSSYNSQAVGSGPFSIVRINRTSVGLPSSIELRAFRKYALGSPYLARLTLRFYQNEDELIAAQAKGEVESMDGLTPIAAAKLVKKEVVLLRTPLPRIFSVFFNQSQVPLLAEREVRQALTLATDKEALVEAVLQGFGVPIDAPVPPLLFEKNESAQENLLNERVATANSLLEKANWKVNKETGIREKKKGKNVTRLAFSLATSDVAELKTSAEMLAKMWQVIGVEVTVKIFEAGDLNQNVIRPRKFDALLFGEIVGRDRDLFAFWHSSQRNDPGLNVSGYANAKVDKWLDDARQTTDDAKRMADYQNAVAAIQNDAPAVFLYSPEFMYLLPPRVKGYVRGSVAIPSERFLDIHRWYTDTKKVWSIFIN